MAGGGDLLQASARALGLELVDYNQYFDERWRVCGSPWVNSPS